MFDDAFFNRPAHLINRVARLMTRVGETRMKPLGFSPGQLPVLGALSRHGPLSQKALAQGGKIEQSSMAQMLARMERDGLVTRRADPDDGRSNLYSLTDTARDRLPALSQALTEGGRDALAGFSAEEEETLRHLLKRVIANLERMAEG
jgi:DNA-binding MarR family transcriptional regulator